MTDYLMYWRPAEAEESLKDGGPLEEIWSKQLKRASRGDRILIVSNFKGKLHLYGMIEVQSTKPDVNRGCIAKGKPASARPPRRISLAKIVQSLEFKSLKGKTRLKVVDGRVDAQQMRTMRCLEPSSAELLLGLIG